MAMMSFLSSLRLPDNAASDATHQWLQYDDLFDQLIDPEPESFGHQSGASRNGPEPCSSPSYIEYLEGRSTTRNTAAYNGMSSGLRPPESSSYGHARALAAHPPAGADSMVDTGSPQLGGGDKLVESERFEPAVPRALDVTRAVSCEAPNRDPVASNSLPFQQSSPISPPLTENNSSFGGSVKSVLSGGIRKVYRKGSISPTRMAHPSFSRRPTDWAQKLEASADIDVKTSRHDPWSPPPSDRIPQWDDNMAFGSSSSSSYHQHHSSRSGSYQPSMNSHSSHPSGSSRLPPRTLPSQRQTPASTPYSTSNSTFDPLITSPQVEGSLSWDSSFSPFQQYSVDASPAPRQFDDSKVQPWYSPDQTALSYGNSYSQPTYTQHRHSSQHSDNVPTLPSQDSYSTSASSQGMAGLGINTTAGFESSSYPLYGTEGYPLGQSRSQQLSRPSQQRQQSDRQASLSSSESSSPSSPNAQSRSTLAARRASRPHSAGRRSKSQGSAPSSKAAASVGFVNFTPSDSKRLLTGVAPSGSSKTKARREKEAADRRRRLSQAAARAVLEAGGDVAALEREGLLGYA